MEQGFESEQEEPVSRDRAMWGWQQEAACRGQDTTYFFAPNYFEKKRQKDAREAKAKALCTACPVREVCLEYALKIDEEHGVWGGLNEQERRQLARRRAMGIVTLRPNTDAVAPPLRAWSRAASRATSSESQASTG